MKNFSLQSSAAANPTFTRALTVFRNATLVLVIFLNMVLCANLFAQDLPSPTANLKTLALGSYVIAMDNTNQANSINEFNLKAYGLVVHLLNNNVKVKWVIKAGKLKDGIDFSVNATRIKPATATAANFDFKSGPFIIQAADVSGVAAIIDGYNNALSSGDRVKVYQTNAAVTVDERYDLSGFKPKAALLNNGGNWTIHRDYLIKAGVTAGINDYMTVATNWSKSIASDLLVKCFTFASEPHYSQTNIAMAKPITDNITTFLKAGFNVLAECAAVRTYENTAKFHSTNGINATTENAFNGSLSTLLYPNADLSYSQFQGSININKGGSLKNWTYAGTVKNNEHDHAKGPSSSPNIGASIAKIGTTAKGGLLFYLGNHNYDRTSDATVLNGIRMYLNAFLTPPDSYTYCLTTTPQPTTGSDGEQCFTSPTIPNIVNANTSWTYNNTNQTYTFRTTFAKTFVDNTYGANAIGWSKGHTFSDLVGSDNLQMALLDASGTKKMEFKLDYISASSAATGGYKSLGVLGGDGKMIVGSTTDVVSAKTSLDANFNDYNYVLTTNSPATNATYSQNATYPNWIYDVWYEVTVKASAFGASGFGNPLITGIHASPSKTGNNTEVVIASNCPGIMKLGNTVFNDANSDGIKQLVETGIGGLVVKLYADNNGDNVPDGAVLESTTTDVNGYYGFSALAEGKYIVGVVKTNGYAISGNSAGSTNPDNDVDNDNNGIVDAGGEIRTNFITLLEDTEPITDGDDDNGNLTLDIGLHKISTPPSGTEICYASTTNPNIVNARILSSTNNTNGTITFRIIFSKTFVDNTYGTNAIGWTRGHTFGNLVGSDHVELSFLDANNTAKMQFRLDYISASTDVASGYKCLGVTGGEGRMILGNAADVVSAKSSLDANFNDYGYVLTTNSPATDANYTPNAVAPNWIYDVWYEVTIKSSALGSAGPGKVYISNVHASPSKTGNNSEAVVEVPCQSVLRLGNLVFKDVNDNGIKDTNEPGISGVTVKLYADNNADNNADGGVLATTTTDANGNYLFTNLSTGNYIVGVVLPAGYAAAVTTSTSDNPNNDIENDNNGVNTVGGDIRSKYISISPSNEPFNDGDDNNGNLTLDFGLKAVVATTLNMGNLVFNDANSNGIKDNNEAGVAGATIYLYKDVNGDNIPDGAAIATTTTNASGIYGFSSLEEGKYIVGLLLPNGFIGSATTINSFNPDSDVDNDNNGVTTVNGNELQSKTITLTANGEPVNDGDGANGNLTLDFGIRIYGSLIIGDYVWEDTNGNGLQDTDEYGINGLKVTLTYADGTTQVTFTDADGYYFFNNLVPGTYTVKFDTPDGFKPTIPNAGRTDRDSDVPANGGAVTVTISAAPGNTTIDAGYVKVLLTLGNEVFKDVNANGVKDAGEPGIAGLTVHLYKDDNSDNMPDGLAIATANTDVNGIYSFTNLQAGNYIVSVQLVATVWQGGPLTFNSTNPNNNIDGDNNGIVTYNNEVFSGFITLNTGTEPTNDGDGPDGNLTLDFGLIPTPPQASNNYLGNRIFYDQNGNGILDAGEVGIAGATVNLYDDINGDNQPDGPASQTVVTAADGSYGFGLLDDINYMIGVILPQGYTISSAVGTSTNPNNDVDSDNNGVTLVNGEVRTNFITLAAGTEPTTDGDGANGNLTLDIGLIGNSVIGDFVWNDVNGNGLQDGGEPGIKGVVVKLTMPNGTVLTTTTNANGAYSFTNLAPGTYTVNFITPAFYNPTFENVGSNDNIDSDPVNGTVTVTITGTQVNNTVDAGFIDDIDDDDDGIIDIVESHGYDGLKDCDGDGIPNYMDATPGCPIPAGNDIYGNPFKPLVWIDCARPGFPNGDGINDFFDFDHDGIINQLDLDSDNDGILDVTETMDPNMVDNNHDGKVDGGDTDRDGLLSTADGTPNVYGGPGLTPQDLDRDGLPNYLDLDSDGDGLSDLTEARGFFDNDGIADGTDSDKDGVNDSYDQITGSGAVGVTLTDNDGDGKINPYDIDSDNDGITDNVEGQPTCAYKKPTGLDSDGDGMDDAYDTYNNTCILRAPGITPYDKDGDGTPDIYDLDTDNDGALDVNEGSGIYGDFVTITTDIDGDGLIDQFDIFNIRTATSNLTNNVVHSNMGTNGSFDGPLPAGSNARLPQSASGDCSTGADRDWRNISILPVTLVNFSGTLTSGKTALLWKVASEQNISNYTIERSTDGQSFNPIGKVAAKGSGSLSTLYNYYDDVAAVTSATVYYRLKMIENGGTYKYSSVLSFKVTSKGTLSFGFYPNPANSYLQVKVNAQKDGVAALRIIDGFGKIVYVTNTRISEGSNIIGLNNISTLPSGIYNVQLVTEVQTLNQKLVIAR